MLTHQPAECGGLLSCLVCSPPVRDVSADLYIGLLFVISHAYTDGQRSTELLCRRRNLSHRDLNGRGRLSGSVVASITGNCADRRWPVNGGAYPNGQGLSDRYSGNLHYQAIWVFINDSEDRQRGGGGIV